MFFRYLFAWPQIKSSRDLAADVAGRGQLRLALAAALLLIAGSALITPNAAVVLPQVPGFLAIYATAMTIFSVLVAFLCLMRGLIEAQGDSTRLGAAYLFTALLMIAQLMAYSGAILPGQFIGGPATAFWLWAFWHVGFALAILHYSWVASRPIKPKALFSLTVSATLAFSAGAILAAVKMGYVLPPIFGKGISIYDGGLWWLIPILLLLATTSALVSVISLKARSPEQVWLAVGVFAAVIDIWLHWQGGSRFSLGFYAAKSVSILTSLTVLLSKLQQITQLYAESASHNKRLIELVHKDGLTGLSNRRRFDELLGQEFNRAYRNSLPLGLILLDVDWFKSYNDTYGHLAGDECLRAVAQSVSGVLKRAGDELARYGGEEMVVLLPSTDLRGTLKIAQQMCDSVAALEIDHAGSGYGRVTISAGASVLSCFDKRVLPADLVGAADKALYQAKSEGRNRVSSIESPEVAQKLCV